MYNIYDMLKSGKSADEIADLFTSELNEAIQQKKAEDQALEAEQAQATYKKGWADDIADELCEFIEEHYPVLVDPEAKEDVITGEMIITFFDAMATFQEGLNGLKIHMSNIPHGKSVSIKTKDNISEIFDNFFAKHGL